MPDDSSIKEKLIEVIRTKSEPEPKPIAVSLPDIPTSWERYTVLIVFSIAALYMMRIGNTEAAVLALGNIATYFLSRTGA